MAFEKFHHKIVVDFDDEGQPIKERVTLPKFDNIPFGLIRKNRKLPEEEQFFSLLEQVASEEDLDKMDRAPQSEMEKLMKAWQEDSGITLGGIAGLLELILHDKKGPALEADLLSAGFRLRHVGTEQFSWRDLKIFLENLDVHSKLFAIEHPDEAGWDRKVLLMADMVDSLRWLVWAKTKDGQKNRKHPKPIPRPGIKQHERRVKGEAVPIDQFQEKMALLRARMKSSTAEETVTRIRVRDDKKKAEKDE
ncbi:tail assembly chaperone [Gordonia phage Lauer]|uniref:Tail assembly chaperone n=2 Tax=Ponsvirus TaxID=3044795 RepID=A0A7G8LQJ2_9CAUD|nr:tail assembly chaperone [Gordonia phage Lauer]YP_010663361.1 tail assembly chaperone [Gordonia phage BigChungus]QGJ92123.1 tail assembly chaperone [Gordonia phage Lauer]QNJ59374.1 tail assembly chaperone [Gordonia phage Feastonyeet]QNJ59514.1 tail assembly chaperone [Gordonia phage BigChungus]